MNISGIGVVFNRGRGIKSLECALTDGWIPPENSIYSVKEDILKDKTILNDARRADRLTKMAVLAANDAFVDSGLAEPAKKSLGLIVATGFGPHVTTFRFLDDLLNYSDANVSPTIFSHSVHNAAASYISLLLQSRGPTLTITQFANSFYQAIMLAEIWLNEGRCEHILVGCVDQCGEVMQYICRQKLNLADDGKIKPFVFSKTPEAVPGEGSVFFLLTNQTGSKKYASISALSETNQKKTSMCVLDCDGMCGNEETYLPIKKIETIISGYTPIFGSMLTVSGFTCATAALMLKNQYCYAPPIQDNPHQLNLCKISQPAIINSISCIRYDCQKEKREIILSQ